MCGLLEPVMAGQLGARPPPPEPASDEVFSGGVGSFPCMDWNLSREIQGPSIVTRVWV